MGALPGIVVPLGAVAGQAFTTSALVLGALLVVGALASGLARRSFLSLTAVFVVAGFVLGHGALGVLPFHASSPFVGDLAVVALIVILFRDGLEVEGELLQSTWRVPLRKLVIAMPITAGLIALVAHAVTDLGWLQALLLGSLLAPTDPVLSSSVVTNPRVPRRIRHSLNLESGMNDGLALPAVLGFSAALGAGSGDFVWWRFVLQDIGVGLVTGVVVGALAARLLPRERGLGAGMPAAQKSLYALGVAFVAYGVAVLPPAGNGFIAVYVAAITLGVLRPDVRPYFEQRADDLVEVVKLGIFVVFGSLLTFGGLFSDGWAAVAIAAFTLLAARPLAIFPALVGTPVDRATKAFMAWFGPKGVATMTFGLLVLSERIPAGARVFQIAALTVFCSIVLHGLTDTPGANWIARRAERAGAEAERPSAPTAAGRA